MALQEVTKTEKTDFQRDFQENSTNCRFNFGNKMARGAGFDRGIRPAPLCVRAYDFQTLNIRKI